MNDDLLAGDRVRRGDREGVVVESYMSKAPAVGQGYQMYSVKWDGTDYVEHGYLRFGLLRIGDVSLVGGKIFAPTCSLPRPQPVGFMTLPKGDAK